MSQATAQAGNVVYPVSIDGPVPALAEHARAVGHMRAPADPDGVVRRVPLLVKVDDRSVPAFGLALGRAFGARPAIAADGRQRALVAFRNLRVVSLAEVWRAIDAQRAEGLATLVADKVVVVLVEPIAGQRLTPVGLMSDGAIQAHLLDTLLAGSSPRDVPIGWSHLGTFILSAIAAWLWLALRWWQGLIGVVFLAAGALACVVLSLSLLGVVLPLVAPLGATVLASVVALLWNHTGATRRLRHLDAELDGMRDALARQESTVEALEEDLEAARAAVAQSTDALRAQLVEARALEEQTRGRLQAIEHELDGLRVADKRHARAGDEEQERLRRACEALGIVSSDPGMLALFRDLEKVARSSLPILLAGEPGTGKELFARAAHRLGTYADGPFVAVNTAAIPPELFESEMFGHVRGSFTGAAADRKGYFEQADRGTIFLDEVGELRADHQTKLLRVLQDKSFYRVGATRPTTVDVRVVAASNKDLERGTVEGWFREDLFFRLKGLLLRLPPLRQHRQDVALLAARFVEDAAAAAGRPGLTLSEAALEALEAHDWPGNVRELQNCLRRAAALAEGSVIRPEDLGLMSARPASADATGDGTVLACLRRHRFDMQATARALGWDRSTVTQRLKGLGFRALVESGGDRRSAATALAGDPALSSIVEVKLREYHEHLLRSVKGFDSADAAVAACRRRFKNLPERHFHFLETLVRQSLEHPPKTPAS